MKPVEERERVTIAELYRGFGQYEARGVSGTYECWALDTSGDHEVLALLETVPAPKRQPNLVFAAARWHGAQRTYSSFRSTVVNQWPEVRDTILTRATQTNEAGRCAVLLPFLSSLPQPLAIIEVGAAAGLCLLPDRYSYRYDDGTHLDPVGGPSLVTIDCHLGQGIPTPAMPQIVWRAGIDLNPVDVRDPDACSWLESLVWPGMKERRERLRGALALAREDPPGVVAGDLNDVLPALVSEVPPEATCVVFHSAVLAYLEREARAEFVHLVSDLPGHWISNEGQNVVDLPQPYATLNQEDGRFLLAVDGVARALTDPHGRSGVSCAPR